MTVPDRATLLSRFVRDGRLHQLPARRSRRLPLLAWLAERFEPGRDYPETEVNGLLRGDHPDVATLRRLLVDDRFLLREDGIYRRGPGPDPA